MKDRITKWLDVVFPLLVFIGALTFYTLTLNSDVQPADSGELQLAAYTLQVPHPPGYPLLMMLGWLISHIPLGSSFARLSFLSAVIASLAVTVAYITCISASTPRDALTARLYGVIPAFALATSTTFWAQATTFNVRSLTALFTALMAYLAVRSRTHPRAALWGMAAAVGLGVSHHVSLVFVAALMSAFVLWQSIYAKLNGRVYFIAFAILCATQIVWLYLPLRNSAPGVLAHGDLASWRGFLDHVLARGFGNDLFYFVTVAPEQLWDRISTTATLFQFQFSPPVLLAMVVGLLLMLMYQRSVGLLLLACIVLHWFVTITYKAPQTVEYAMPCWVMLCVGITGIFSLPAVRFAPTAKILAAVAMLTIAGFTLRDAAQRWPSYRTLAGDNSTRAHAAAMLRYPNLNEQVFSEWHQATPMWALQAIEGLRPDVRVTYVSPSGTQAYEDTFAERAAHAAVLGRTYITSHFPDQLAARALVSFPLSNTAGWRVDRQIDIASINFARTLWDKRLILVHPLGLPQSVSVGQQINLDMWWSSLGRPIDGDSITVRILFPDGRLAANADVRLSGKEGAGIVEFKRVGFAIPWHLPPGDYALLAGAYNGGMLYKTSDGLDFVPVGQMHIIPSTIAPVTQDPYPFTTTNDSLIGLDYDLGLQDQMRVWTHWQLGPLTQTVVLRNSSGAALADGVVPAQSTPQPQYISLAFDVSPQQGLGLEVDEAFYDLPYVQTGSRYVPFANQMVLIGASTTRANNAANIDLNWLSIQALTQDYRISARLRGDTFYQTHDGYPVLGTLPTFKWIRNANITDRHPFALQGYTGPLKGSVVVYDFSTRLDLIPLDERYEGIVGIEVK